MATSEVQRTLVKSPPELWAELSDPAALARHLGEIRITRVQPEETVEWEAGSTSGTITIKPSGWGTKVTLSVTRDPAAPASPETAGGAPEEPGAPAVAGEDTAAPESPHADAVTSAERFAPHHPAPLLH